MVSYFFIINLYLKLVSTAGFCCTYTDLDYILRYWFEIAICKYQEILIFLYCE